MRKLLYILLVFSLTPCLAQSKGEAFEDFFNNFKESPDFQKKRIIFPLSSITIRMDTEKADTVQIQAEGWKFHDFRLLRSGFQVRFFDSFTRKLRDTDERVVSLIGNDNGVYYSYFFKRTEGKWNLIMILDEST
ncbi:MAG: DUF4348 domain-containing protein [Fibrobacter sp.]|nr:DUF4348 domain-containing protein [Fibrobacter sp.]